MLHTMSFLNKYNRIDNQLSRSCGLWLRFALLSALLATYSAHAEETAPVSPVLVEQVEADATLKLSDGRWVMLDALEIPHPQQTVATLKTALEGKAITLTEEAFDRYGRVGAMVWQDGVLVQWQLVQSGAAMVLAMRPSDRLKDLLSAEAIARGKQMGMWADANWVIDHEAARKAVGSVKIVGGVVKAVAVKSGVGYINFGEDWKTDFSIHLPKATMRKFGKKALQKLVGQKVLVRGLIHDYYGPRITLYEPHMLDVYANATLTNH